MSLISLSQRERKTELKKAVEHLPLRLFSFDNSRDFPLVFEFLKEETLIFQVAFDRFCHGRSWVKSQRIQSSADICRARFAI